jgi:hypothetical protein
MTRKKAVVIEGILVPGRYQDRRKALQQVAEKRRNKDKPVKIKNNIKFIRIPMRIDTLIACKEGYVRKSFVTEIAEHKLFEEKYNHLIEAIGGVDNMKKYISWFVNKEKTKEQLTSLNLYDFKKYFSNQNN